MRPSTNETETWQYVLGAVFTVAVPLVLWAAGYAALRFAFEGLASFAGYGWAETLKQREATLAAELAQRDFGLERAKKAATERRPSEDDERELSWLESERRRVAEELESARAARPLPDGVATTAKITIIGLPPAVMLAGALWAAIAGWKKRRREAEQVEAAETPEARKKRMDELLERFIALNPGKLPPGLEQHLGLNGPSAEPKKAPPDYGCVTFVSEAVRPLAASSAPREESRPANARKAPEPQYLGRGAAPQRWPGSDEENESDFADDEDIAEVVTGTDWGPPAETTSSRTIRIKVPIDGWAKTIYRLGEAKRLHHAKSVELSCLETAVDGLILIGIGNDLRRYGGKLVIVASEKALDEVGLELRTGYPGIRFVPRPPDQPYRLGSPRVTDVPTRAPPNFRDLPPCSPTGKALGGSGRIEQEYAGSGVPFAEARIGKSAFHRCMYCANPDTLCIFGRYSKIYGRHEKSIEFMVEYLCPECGKFTFYETHENR